MSVSSAALAQATISEKPNLVEPETPKPAMTDAEVALFKTCIKGHKSYLEFGCGGSTMVVLDTPMKRIVSVESDANWIAKLRRLERVSSAEKEGRLILHHADIGPTEMWGAPKDAARMKNWPNYPGEIWQLHGGNYDVVFVDGRFRVACTLMAAAFTGLDTRILVHDFSIRPDHYSAILKYLDVEETCDTMVVLKKKKQFHLGNFCGDLLSHALKPT